MCLVKSGYAISLRSALESVALEVASGSLEEHILIFEPRLIRLFFELRCRQIHLRNEMLSVVAAVARNHRHRILDPVA